MVVPPPHVLFFTHTPTDITSSDSSPLNLPTLPPNPAAVQPKHSLSLVSKSSQSGPSRTSNDSRPSDLPDALERKGCHIRPGQNIQRDRLDSRLSLCSLSSKQLLSFTFIGRRWMENAGSASGPSTSRSFLQNLFAYSWQEAASSWASHLEVCIARVKATSQARRGGSWLVLPATGALWSHVKNNTHGVTDSIPLAQLLPFTRAPRIQYGGLFMTAQLFQRNKQVLWFYMLLLHSAAP